MAESEWQRMLWEVFNAPGSGARVERTNAGIFRSMDGKRIVQGVRSGTADLTGMIAPGWHIEIEAKAERGKLRQSQGLRAALCERMGAIYIIAHAPPEDLRQNAEIVLKKAHEFARVKGNKLRCPECAEG